jgi:hypothetical protein
MSKISKHRENIFSFITTKSCFSNIIEKDFFKEFMENDFVLYPIALLSVFSTQIKKNKAKSYHTLHIASALVLMVINVRMNENKKYYEDKYGINNIKKFQNQATIFIFEAITQNIKTMENTIGIEISSKIHKKISSILHEKLLVLTDAEIKEEDLKIKRSDIIKYKFIDKEIIDKKYRKLKRINKEELAKYMNDKYGSIGQCAFIFGWLMGMGSDNPKTLDNVLKIGSSFGILVKLTHDFYNIENDLNLCCVNGKSYNYVINYGIHECFRLYDENKVKFLEGCIANDLYSTSIKELLEKIDKTYDRCLRNTDLELQSQYSSFVSE